MTRDEGPPKDEVTGREPRSPPHDQGRYRQPSIVHGATDSAQNSASNKRLAHSADRDVPDQVRQPEALLDAFAAEFTEDLREHLYAYAARMLSGARKLSADSDAAQELVQQVIFDTLDGRSRWDFVNRRLKPHLKFLIWRQFYAKLRRAKRVPEVPIHAVTADGMALERALRVEVVDEIERAEAWESIAELCRRAQGDADVLVLIDALVRNQMSHTGLRAATGFSMPRYRRAMRRFNRLVDEVGRERQLLGQGKEGT